MSRARAGAGLGLRVASTLVMLFLYFPLAIIVVYAFTTQSSSFTFPPPGLTLDWFGVAFAREDMWEAFRLSLLVAAISTTVAITLGSLLAGAVYRTRFFGREALTFIVLLPIALPGIVTGIALRSTLSGLFDVSPGTFTIVIGHTTFCIVIVFNNVVARLRRLSPNVVEASADLGASGWQTFRHVLMPNLATALLAGGVLAFALSFDEIIVTTFTRGGDPTLPIWIFQKLFRPRNRPVTNVVALIAVTVTIVPVLLAQMLARSSDDAGTGMGAGATSARPRGAIPAE
ncbi:MAG: ABC transporter permease [Actinomycetota bacterium]|nr:ABC transporter permease [Actinomycetota bacterium]MDH5223978.1 ABC transporter permease [Actinomycetota bacterium]MDH5312757.1 ABC transporter permease [Actinomycetota bacterium]